MTKRLAEATGRVFVVHWHPVVLRGLARFLGQLPEMELVGVASSCEQALDMAADLHPHLVLMGYSTPKMGGIEATRRLLEVNPDTRVMLIGAAEDPKRVAEALENGAIGYVLLDTPPSDIAATLRGRVRES